MMVDNDGKYVTYNGTAWTALTASGIDPRPHNNFYGVSCLASNTQCMVVDSNGYAGMGFHGVTWTQFGNIDTSTTFDSLQSVSCDPTGAICVADRLRRQRAGVHRLEPDVVGSRPLRLHGRPDERLVPEHRVVHGGRTPAATPTSSTRQGADPAVTRREDAGARRRWPRPGGPGRGPGAGGGAPARSCPPQMPNFSPLARRVLQAVLAHDATPADLLGLPGGGSPLREEQVRVDSHAVGLQLPASFLATVERRDYVNWHWVRPPSSPQVA